MLRHIVFFTAKDPKDKQAIFDGLQILETIPCDGFVKITANGKHDQIANDVDFVVYGEFKDINALKVYKSHPLYQESIKRVRPLRDMRIAADIEFEE